jgi:hypothetical protein
MKPFFCILCILSPWPAFSIDLWQYPECAEEHAVFLDAKIAGFSFKDGLSTRFPEVSADYLLPFGYPFSAGIYFKMPDPNLKSFGVRFGYHVNLNMPNTDLYVLYVFDFGFIRNKELVAHNDTAQPVHRYDFRVGVRRVFGKLFCLVIESDYKFSGITLGASIKVN